VKVIINVKGISRYLRILRGLSGMLSKDKCRR
jgi:hypothetical protein